MKTPNRLSKPRGPLWSRFPPSGALPGAISACLAGALAIASFALVTSGCGREGPGDAGVPAPRAEHSAPEAGAPRIAGALAPFLVPGPPQTGERLLVVGWDGASWTDIDRLRAEGRLPRLDRLMREGNQASLASTVIPISSAAWTAVLTGRAPGRTGLYSFFKTTDDGYDIRPATASDRPVSPFWELAGRRGLRTIVWGVPMTYPPAPMNGVLVAGMLSPGDADYAHPPGLADSLRAIGFLPDLGTWWEGRALTDELLQDQLARKAALLTTALRNDSWDAALLVFKSLDVLQHAGAGERTGASVDALYETLDRILGRLVDAVPGPVNVIVISDHGFREYTQLLRINGWLVENGFAALRKEADGAEEPSTGGATALLSRNRHRAEIRKLDMARTAAFAGPCQGNFGTIRLNIAGRESRGAVAPDRANVLADAIVSRLEATRVAGVPFVTNVWKMDELYPGPFRGELPDLAFEVDTTALIWPTFGRPSLAPLPSPIADHARTGIWVAAGPGFVARAERDERSIFEAAPVIHHLLGLPAWETMRAEAPASILVKPPSGERVVDAGPRPDGETPNEPTEEELREIEERLRALSYTR